MVARTFTGRAASRLLLLGRQQREASSKAAVRGLAASTNVVPVRSDATSSPSLSSQELIDHETQYSAHNEEHIRAAATAFREVLEHDFPQLKQQAASKPAATKAADACDRCCDRCGRDRNVISIDMVILSIDMILISMLGVWWISG